MENTKNIFVSHYHSDAKYIKQIKDIVEKQGLYMRDSSIYEEKSKNNANNKDYIKSLIRPQIEWAGTVIVLVGKETSKSKWVNWEIENAAQKGKRIIGVYLNGHSNEDIPDALKEHGDALVKWNSKSIVDAINGDDSWNGPKRNWETGSVTC